MYTPKQRMLNAYQGEFSDRYPVAPEFWYYYPAKVLGVDMIEFEREIPFWKALQTTFKKYKTEGWGAAFPQQINPEVDTEGKFEKINDRQYRQTNIVKYKNHEFTSVSIFDREEPSWVVEYPVKDEQDLDHFLEMRFSDKIEYDFDEVRETHEKVGEDYLVEFWLGTTFFDFIAGTMGFEQAIMYFMSGNDEMLKEYREKYLTRQKQLIRLACEQTDYESFAIGNSYANNSLLGPDLWRKWDKPFLKEIIEEIHKYKRLVHIHYHGKCMATVPDFLELNLDCVCPFERPPGGDVAEKKGLEEVRKQLQDKVTMNGNVHTVETLIRGTTEDVKNEVREIKEVFSGSPRLIIGTGDQVGYETPEENIYAMVEEAKKTD